MCGVPCICICSNNREPLPFRIYTSRSLSFQNDNDKFPSSHTYTPYLPSFQKSICRPPCFHTCTQHPPSFRNGSDRFPCFHTYTQYSFGNYPFARSYSPNPSDFKFELKNILSKLHWSFGFQLIKFGQKLKITTAKRAGNEDETHAIYTFATSLNRYTTLFKKAMLCSLDVPLKNHCFPKYSSRNQFQASTFAPSIQIERLNNHMYQSQQWRSKTYHSHHYSAHIL